MLSIINHSISNFTLPSTAKAKLFSKHRCLHHQPNNRITQARCLIACDCSQVHQLLKDYNINQLSMLKYPDLWRGYFCDSVGDQDDDKQFVVHLDFSTLNIIKNQGPGKIHGQGKSQQGNFVVDGSEKAPNQYLCEYKSPKRSIFFKVNLNQDGSLKGSWGVSAEKVNSGAFGIKKIQQFEGWNGYYCQFDIQSQMKFEKLIIDAAPGGNVQGHGSDECGPFTLKGAFQPINNEVFFVKTYHNQVRWEYWGTLNDGEVSGFWGVKKPLEEGTFKLYYLK